ncbi:CrtA2 protein [Candidatus Vecturithrix granuli]|uniref:CrtA2 protein n=1 Tax=Vecturithrix granuli TaxID=1499967 RepID=A0A081C0H1_VECG1|nr:CrtA2 protein [Candidatus Vecturithrix granuli]
MKTHVIFDSHENIGRLTFAAEVPNKPPTLDYDVLDELEGHLKNISSQQASFDAIIVQSQSSKYFVVGANLQALQQIDKDSILSWIRRGHEVFNRLEDLPLPVIAKITGYALGGGLELALACDFIVSSHNASFGQPETGLGFIPGWAGSYRLPRRIGEARAKELVFTGKTVSAEEAYRIGLTNFVGTDQELEHYLLSTLQAISKNSRLANSLVKPIIKNSLTSSLQTSCYEESVASSVCLASGDTQQRLKMFFEARTHK